MPFPREPFKIHGGCNCRSIRYSVNVPAFSDRPKTVYCNPGADIPADARIPAVYVDHCNDCRRATSSVLPTWLVAETLTVTVSCMPVEALPPLGKVDISDDKRQWRSAEKLLHDDGEAVLPGTTLSRYVSSEGRNRWFCRNCGTPICYSIWESAIPKDWGWPKMLDICLGTVDREDIEKEYMRPERQLWCAKGVPWIRELASQGIRLNGRPIPQHPLTKIDKLVGDDISGDLKEPQSNFRIEQDPLELSNKREDGMF